MDIADGNNVQLSTSMSFVEELLIVLISIQWSNKVKCFVTLFLFSAVALKALRVSFCMCKKGVIQKQLNPY